MVRSHASQRPSPSEGSSYRRLTLLAVLVQRGVAGDLGAEHVGLARRRHVALFQLWFLGIGSVANGLLRPLLAR